MRATKYAAVCLLLVLSLTLALHGDLPQVATGTWTALNSLSEARTGSAAVVLDDGRVLLTGGSGTTGPLASSELFSILGSFSQAAPMQNPRTHHTATTLLDGRVLVAGGTASGGGATSSAEIYDPSGNSWTPVPGGMTSPRSGHTASRLNDGRVLIAGGSAASGATNTLEIYSPDADTFTAVTSGTLSAARLDHAASLLSDGRVLIAGGSDGSASLSSTDIFDPASGSVSAGPSMAGARAGLSATTLIDGRVLVAGGNNGTADLASAEIYNPASRTFSATGGLATPRRDHLVFLLPHNNGVLIAGGSSAGAAVASAELFYSWTGAFTATSPMSTARTAAAGSALNIDGRLLVAGGSDGANPLGSAELYGFATIKTDKADYAPGTTVTISGSGWQPGETVTLTLVESPLLDTHGPFTAVADSVGNITHAEFSPDEHDIDIRFYLTATGSVSQAQTTFTDAGPASDGDGTMTVSPTSVTAGSTGNTFAFVFTSPSSKDFNGGSQATILVPAGWTAPTTAAGAGHVSVAPGSPACTGLSLGPITGTGPWTIPINMTCPAKAQFTVTYSSVTAPTTAGANTFTTKTKQAGGTLSNISTQSTVTVQAATTTSVTAAVNPTVFGQPVTFTATVSTVAPATGTPTGTVTFNDGATAICSTVALNGSAQATCAPSLPVGSHSITAVYTGSSDTPQSFTGSTSSATTQTVNQASTTTAVTSSTNPSVFGQSVTFTATVAAVAPGAGTLTGSVTFKDSGTTLGTGTLNGSGVATFATSSLSVAVHSITAVYAGDTNFTTSTSSILTHTVNQANTTTAVTSSASTSVFGQPVTFTATVGAVAPGSGTPTGTVQFAIDGTSFGSTVTLSGGTATSGAIASLSVGPHTVTAVYSGDTTFKTSTSANFAQTVNKANTTTAITSDSPDPSVIGQTYTVKWSVTVNSLGAGTPTGTVTITSGAGNTGGTCSAAVEVGQCDLAGTTSGTKTVTVSYGGDGSFNISSTTTSHTVNKVSTTTAVISSLSPSILGQSVTFTATISPTSAGAGTPSGTVQFKDGGTNLGAAQNVSTTNGVTTATLTTSALAVGTHTITAVYNGDTNFSTSTSLGITQVVDTLPAITSVNNATFGEGTLGSFTVQTSGSLPITLTESGGLPSGVAFTDNGNGTGTLSGTPAGGTSANSPYVISFTATNPVGITTQNPFTLTILSPPAPPSAPTLLPSTTGNPEDNITTSATPSFFGTTTGPITTVTIYSDGVQVGSGSAANYANSSVGVSVTTPLSLGTHVITVKATNAAGAVSAASDPLNITVITTIKVTSIGTQNSNTTVSSLTQPASVKAGNTVFVTLAMDPDSTGATVSDSMGNFTKDADVTNGTGTNGVRTLVFSQYLTADLNGNITINFPSAVNAAATFFSFNGIVSSAPEDLCQTQTGNSSNPSSGTTATTWTGPSCSGTSLKTTAQPYELLIGAAGFEDKTQTLTPGDSFTNLTPSMVGGGNSNSLIEQASYLVVSDTGQYGATWTGNQNKTAKWAAAIVTYKIVFPTIVSIVMAPASITTPPSTTNLNSVNFTVTFSEPVFGVDAEDFALDSINTTVSGASITGVTTTDNTVYTVAVNTGTGNGTIQLNYHDDADLTVDANNIPLNGSSAGAVTVPGLVYTISKSVATSLTVAAASGTYGGTVSLSATLKKTSDNSAVPNESISFTLNGNSVGSATTNASGVATLSNVSLTGINVGTYATAVAASFAGDSNLLASNGSNSLTVGTATTTTAITSAATIMYNANGSVTVAVTSLGGTVIGNVSLTVDSTTASKALSSGSVTFTSVDNPALASPNAGDHALSASYAAQGNFAASGPTPGTLHVNPASTTTTISAPAITYNANGNVTVTVTSAAGTATGNVSLSVDGGTAALQPLSGGSSTFTLTSPNAGDHSLSASYAAQGNFAGSGPTPGTLHVNPASTTTTISAPAITYNANGSVTVTVTSAAGTATGNVSLSVDGGTAALQPLSGGSSTFTLTSPNAGDHSLSASYAAQGNFAGSGPTLGTLHVNQATPTFSVSAPTTTTFGTAVSLSVTISAPSGTTPTGTVVFSFPNPNQTVQTFYICSNGDLTSNPLTCTTAIPVTPVVVDNTTSYVATVTTTKLPHDVNADSITAIYSGDSNFTGGAPATLSATVNQANTSVTLDVTPLSPTFGEEATLAIKVSNAASGSVGMPTGSVLLSFKTSANSPSTYICYGGAFSPSPCDPNAGMALNLVLDGDTNDSNYFNTGVVAVKTSALPAGTLILTASYPGDNNFSGNSVNPQVVVQQAKTTTTVTSSSQNNTSTYGDSVTFTASVVLQSDITKEVPEGCVVFKEGATTVSGPTTVSAGHASFSTTSLSVAGSAHIISADFYDDGANCNGSNATASNNYETSSNTVTQTVNKKTVTATITASDKDYDGTKTASITSCVLSGVLAADNNDVNCTASNAMFSDANAGSGKTVTATISLGGTAAGNYTLGANTTATTTAKINPKSLTTSIMGNPTKPYDGNANATLTSANFALYGLVGSDSFTVTKNSGTYNTKDVATATTVTATLASGDFTPGAGTLAGNYALPTTASGAGHITAVTLTASIIGDPTRPYNGNTMATLTAANFSLSGLVASESFTVTKTYGAYNSKDVATATTVTASLASGHFTPGAGTVASNYVLPTTASGAGHITAVTLTAAITGDPTRPYNGNDTATLTPANFSLTGLVSGESITVTKASGTYNSKDVVAAATVTASLADTDFAAGTGTLVTNYVLPTTATGAGHITAVTLTASIVGDPTKPYNGNPNATLAPTNFSLFGLVSGESFAVTQTAGTYNSKDVAAATTVTASLTASNFTASAGTLASNYSLSITASGAGHITALTLTASIVGDPTKPYNGNTNATLSPANFSLSGLIGSESFTATKTSGTYNSKDVATANNVTTSLGAGDFTPAGGVVASNYTLPTTASGAGHITAVTLTASIIGDPTRPYNGNTNATLTSANFSLGGLIGSEGFTVTKNSGDYNGANVATANTVTTSLAAGDFTPVGGALASNYTLPTTASGAGHITGLTLTASIISNPTKPYDGNASATLTPGNFSLSGLISGESFTVTQTAGTYNSKDVAAATTVTASLTASSFTAGAGTLASNYNLSITASGAGHITAVTLTASIIGDPTRPYNGNTIATLTSANFSLSGLIGSESFNVTKATGTYNSKDVATANNVTTSLGAGDFTPAGGVLSSNYTLPTTASGAGHITLAAPTVTVTDPMPTYDGSPHSATATATGVGGAGVSGTFSFTHDGSGTAPTNAKTSYAVVATFTSTDPNYTGATGNGKLTIKQATPTVVVSGGPFPYNGSTRAATNTATGVGGVSVSGTFGVTYTPGGGAPVNAGTYSVNANFTSGDPNYTNSSGTGSITITQVPATVLLSNLNQTYTGSPLAATATTAPAGLTLNVTYSPTAPTSPGSYSVTATVVDTNYYGVANGTLTINDVAPSVTITAPASGLIVAANTTVTFNGTFSDIGPKGPYTAKFTFDGGTPVVVIPTMTDGKSGTVTTSYKFTSAGVYNITLSVMDAFSTTGTANTVNNDNTSPAYIVVYDPTAGFVTGGGWIMSNPGSYVANSALTGKANFGFVSKYQKGATVPTGETEFNFQVANFNFHASIYQWMVVSGSQAQYKGTGTINGSGNYNFLLTALDGGLSSPVTQDGFRIKITDPNTNAVIYDNRLGTDDSLGNTQALGGGSIVIHK